MPSTRITLTMADNVRIVVPDSLNLITPYVLLEQNDWFEDEIKFLRKLLRPGQKVIDVGANYGVYTLSMAQTVGSMGFVWAFEPASSTAGMLEEAINANGFAHVAVERSALSSTCGTAQLTLNDNSELNALVRGNEPVGASERVPLLTLDECLQRYDWEHIAFMKIDAEGEEANILKGGGSFFSELSPLVQYEIKAGMELHLALVDDFASHGYRSYRLVPGLDLLVPFELGVVPDGYMLNLFCCKEDRANELAAQGFLLNGTAPEAANRVEQCSHVVEKIKAKGSHAWQQTIARLPYGRRLQNLWLQTIKSGESTNIEDGLTYYAVSRDMTQPVAIRFRALESAFELLKSQCVSSPSFLRWASLARIAQDIGERSIAVSALGQLAALILENRQVELGEPFLAPSERFDSISPNDEIRNWVLAAVLEQFELLCSFSSFYTGMSAHERLTLISSLGFGSPEMDRRLSLLHDRFGLSVKH